MPDASINPKTIRLNAWVSNTNVDKLNDNQR